MFTSFKKKKSDVHQLGDLLDMHHRGLLHWLGMERAVIPYGRDENKLAREMLCVRRLRFHYFFL